MVVRAQPSPRKTAAGRGLGARRRRCLVIANRGECPLGCLQLSLLIAFFGHTFKGEVAARRLGWPAGNPFQTELGIWDGAATV
jgi:hypothetical protein